VVSDVLDSVTNTRWVTWTRPLDTFDGGIGYFTNGPTNLVHAWHSGLQISYHGIDKRGIEWNGIVFVNCI